MNELDPLRCHSPRTCRGRVWRSRLLGALLLVATPGVGWAQESRLWDKVALWAEFIYTLRSWEDANWVITPSVRTDEQELNSTGMSRVTTDVTFSLPDEWDIRPRYFLIGRLTEADDFVFDHRIQVLARKTLARLHDEKIRLRAGVFYERHFRGDAIDDFNVYRTRLELRGDELWNEPWAQQDFFFDHDRGFFRTRTRVGLLWNLKHNSQLRIAYQFQYTQDRSGDWGRQHALVVRYWFGNRLSWRGVN